MKYDPYLKRYVSKEDYIRECYGWLLNESMLEEQYDKLPDHPGEKSEDPVAFLKLWVHDENLPYSVREAIKKL